MKILIAEDNVFSRSLLEKILVKAGYEVITVVDGNAAWEALNKESAPMLVLIDWLMPGLSGLDLCRKIRENQSGPPPYLILLTAKSGKEDVLEGFAAGADDFIKKPFDKGELLARIQVGRRLVEQYVLLRCLVDAVPDPIYFKDAAGAYLGCNKAYSEFVGKDECELVKQTDQELWDSDKQINSEDVAVLKTGEPSDGEYWTVGANGDRVYHSTSRIAYKNSDATPLGMVAISRDLTHRVGIEQELKRLAVAVEQSTESIMIMDPTCGILYVNIAFEKASGFSQEEVLGKTPSMLKGDKHDDAFFDDIFKTVIAESMWKGNVTHQRKDGSFFTLETIIYPIYDESNTLMNFVAISRDITHELAIEKHLRQTQKMNAIGELAGGIAHDFNNILTTIVGYVSLSLSMIDKSSDTHEYLTEVLKAGDRATRLVRQILTFSRQEEQVFHSVLLQEVIDDSLCMVKTTMNAHVVFETDIDEQCGTILGDTTQIQQVLVNLCTNSVFALGEEGGTLHVALKQFKVTSDYKEDPDFDLGPGEYACMSVEDNGSGMSKETIDHIFEPYFTTKKKGEGTGIGLAMVHGIIQKHEGCITVESTLGKGTLFRVYFPLKSSVVS